MVVRLASLASRSVVVRLALCTVVVRLVSRTMVANLASYTAVARLASRDKVASLASRVIVARPILCAYKYKYKRTLLFIKKYNKSKFAF